LDTQDTMASAAFKLQVTSVASLAKVFICSSVADPDPGWIFSGSRIQGVCFLVIFS
jgi:hypothetical protein